MAGGAASGIDHSDLSGPDREGGKSYLRDTVGRGVAVLDLDQDGLMDLYFPQGRDGTEQGGDAANRLYRNLGDGRFEECAQERGADHRGYGFGALAFDYDSDGDSDLLLTNWGPNALLRNDDGRFVDVTARHPGIAGADADWSVGAAAADIDGDGDLDLYLCNYCEQDLASLDKKGWCRQMSCEIPCGPRGLAPQADRVFLNQGAPHFTLKEGAGETGLLSTAASYAFQPTFSDIDNDGDLDLYVTNDSVANYLFVNDGSGHYTETALVAGVACGRAGQMEAGMGLAVGHANDDPLPEFFVTNFSTQSNSLYWNESNALTGPWFEEMSHRAGLGRPSWFQLGWGCSIADFDNDGFSDVFSANGHIFEQMDQCAPELVVFRQPNSLFRGTSVAGVFDDVSEASGLATPGAHRGSARVDLDNDGRLDLVIARLENSPLILWNRSPKQGHWFGATLRRATTDSAGPAGPMPVGARLTLHAADRSWTRDLTVGSSFLSTEDPRFHVGLGEISRVDRLELRLPGEEPHVLSAPPLALDRWIQLEIGPQGLRIVDEVPGQVPGDTGAAGR